MVESAPIDVENLAGATPREAGEDLCTRFVELLPVTGVSISVLGGSVLGGTVIGGTVIGGPVIGGPVLGGSVQSTIGASDPIAERVEELQFELGEGPHWEAIRTGAPVLVPDLRASEHSRWPVFVPAVREIGVGALFAFPLVMGAVTIGVADMYRSAPGALDAGSISRALSIAASTAGSALRLAARSADQDAPTAGMAVPEMRREVHQATGMILAQLETSATEAFSRLQAHAFSGGRTIQYVAHEVVMRRLDFRDFSE